MQLNDFIKITDDFYKACETATSLEEVRKGWTNFFKYYGSPMFSYHHTPPIGTFGEKPSIVVGTYGFPDIWHEFYKSGGYDDDDPIIRLAQLTGSPLWKSDLMEHCWDTVYARKHFEFSHQLDIQDFLVIPVYGPRGHNGCFTIGFKTLPDIPRVKLTWLLANACQIAHLKHIELKRQTTCDNVKLSPREKQILKLMLLGKNNSNIAEILDVSRHTVDSYTRQSYLKLGVNDRVSASLRAIALGLV